MVLNASVWAIQVIQLEVPASRYCTEKLNGPVPPEGFVQPNGIAEDVEAGRTRDQPYLDCVDWWEWKRLPW